MKECYLYQKLKDNKIRCQTCNHYCTIADGKVGICGVRQNQKGKLYLLVYGRAIAAHIDPVEKKPLYHFLPGTRTYTIATIGCNFRCAWCQNFDISQASKLADLDVENFGQELPPEKIVQGAIDNKCPSISYSYTEPTIFLEYALDTMKLAHQHKLKNIWVSNGYMSPETLDLITPHLDAINVDLKGFDDKNYLKYCGAKLQPVLDNIAEIYKRKIHLEVTTLIIPGVNDDQKQLQNIAEFLAGISKDIPWHISRYFPAYKMEAPPTPIETLELAEAIGQKAGLKYIHLGNV